MNRTSLLSELKNYAQGNTITPAEHSIHQELIEFITSNENCFDRANKGHITSSIWIVNSTLDKALLTHHKKLNMWLQLGGHNDGNADCKSVALQEAQEESGIQGFTLLVPTIFDIDIHPIPSKCEYHYDIRYLLQAESDDIIISDESLDLAWVPFDKIQKYTAEQSIMRMHEKAQKILRR